VGGVVVKKIECTVQGDARQNSRACDQKIALSRCFRKQSKERKARGEMKGRSKGQRASDQQKALFEEV
jgi:hypothetical protein